MRASDEMLKRLGHNITVLRERAGYLQSSVAQSLGIDKSTLSRWEHGIVDPGVSGMWNLSVFYGLTMDELLDEEVPHPLLPETVGGMSEALIDSARRLDAERARRFKSDG